MKKLTTGEVNLMKKFNITDVEAPSTTLRSNRFSGETVTLNEAAAKMYDLVISMNDQYDSGRKINVQDFDRLRYLFAKLWSAEYMTLLD